MTASIRHTLLVHSTWCLAALLLAALSACSSGKADAPDAAQEDPLKNTKALVLRGHTSLYDNGALRLPYTSVMLIPKGPEWQDLALDSARANASAAFYLNLKQAKESVVMVADGTRYSFQVASSINRRTSEVVAAIRGYARPNSILIANRADLAGVGLRGESLTLGANVEDSLARFGKDLRTGAAASGDRSADRGVRWIQASPELLDAIVEKSFAAGNSASASLDATATRLAGEMHWQGDHLILSGVERLGTSPGTVAQSYRSAAERGRATQGSLEASGRGISDSSAATGNRLTGAGVAMAGGALATGQQTYAGIAAHAPTIGQSVRESGQSLAQSADTSGGGLAQRGTHGGKETIASSQSSAGESFRSGMSASGGYFATAGSAFVLGYAAAPKKVAGRFDKVEMTQGRQQLSQRLDNRDNWRSENSGYFTGMLSDTRDSYSDNVRLKLDEASQTYRDSVPTNGVTLAAFKALTLVVEGVLWEGALKPAGKATGAAVGYLAVNGVMYPTLVAVDAGRFTANLAVEVTQASAGSGYDIVAPTGAAAVAATLGIANAAVATGKATVIGGGGTLLGSAEVATSQVAGRTVQAGGIASGKAIEYIGVPLVQTGVHLGAGAAGVVSGSSALLGGSALAVTGQAVKGTGIATGAVVEHGVAPVADATVQTMGVAGGVVEGAYDETTGALLVATGGAVHGSALATEATLKYGAAPLTEGTVKAGGVVGGATAGVGQAAAGSAVYVWGETVKTSGWVAGRTVQHGVAPLVMAGIVATGTTAGVTTQGSGRVAQGALVAAGEVASGVTWVFGNTMADATVAGGAVGSAAYGSAVTLYEVAQSMVVPVGHIGGAGIALGYRSISQIAAHSLLGVADASYLVLSLEGPRWVLYAVQGKLGSGKDLPPGTVVDLKAMQAQGEVIYNVPVSDEELKRIVDTMPDDMAKAPAAKNPPVPPKP